MTQLLLAGSGALYAAANRPLSRDERRHLIQQRETIFALGRLSLEQRRKIKRLESELRTVKGKLFVARVLNGVLKLGKPLREVKMPLACFAAVLALISLASCSRAERIEYVEPPHFALLAGYVHVTEAVPIVEINGRPGVVRHIANK